MKPVFACPFTGKVFFHIFICRHRMSQEELKFSNTIVASGHDLLLIGGTSGRQKRERKVPSRYQDTGNYISDFVFRFFCHENMRWATQLSKILLHDHLKIVLKVPTCFQDTGIEQEQGDNEQKKIKII